MKKISLILLTLLLSQYTMAALPTKYQNMRDLDAIIKFIKSHDVIMASLKSIDFEESTVYFGYRCQALFGRTKVKREQGWTGPASSFEFKIVGYKKLITF